MPDPATPPFRRPSVVLPGVVLTLVIVGCMAWADSVKYLVTDPADYAYFPPFKEYENRLKTDHLGAEYLCIAYALRDGRGFADPFKVESGPTAWMPPVLPYLMAGVLWAGYDDEVTLKYAVVGLQTLTLVFSAWLVVMASARAFGRPWLGVFFGLVFGAQEFYSLFQMTHDPWLILLCLDVLLLGVALLPETPTRLAAVGWGAVGGAVALCGPVLGVVWAALTVARWPWRWRAWLGAVAVAGVVLLPWTVRNYATFGKVIPLKSNAFYELYQATCLTRENDGLVGADSGFTTHPWAHPGPERDLYVELGEMEFLRQKRAIFLDTLRRDPGRFAVHVWNRLAAATVVYVPFTLKEQKQRDTKPTWSDTFTDVVHPLPFLACVVLLLSRRPLHRYEVAALLCYAAWLLPYVLVSYYGRYGVPLVAVKAFLCAAAADRIWSLVWEWLRGRGSAS